MNFSSVSFTELKSLCPITESIDDVSFEEWMQKGAEPTIEQINVLKELIDQHRLHIESYTEEEIKMQVLAPLLSLVRYHEVGLKTWYERTLTAEINGQVLRGQVDFILARGDKEPELPFFLLQEFKPEFTNQNPEVQLIAELIVNAALSPQQHLFLGAYTNAGIYRLVRFFRKDEGFEYQVSRRYDCMHQPDLIDIFRYFKALKIMFKFLGKV